MLHIISIFNLDIFIYLLQIVNYGPAYLDHHEYRKCNFSQPIEAFTWIIIFRGFSWICKVSLDVFSYFISLVGFSNDGCITRALSNNFSLLFGVILRRDWWDCTLHRVFALDMVDLLVLTCLICSIVFNFFFYHILGEVFTYHLW